MAEAIFTSCRPGTESPPPNCAICLGTCTNKCYSDSCMHEFCFKCLLEWSKIKAECPLCKQTFKSILHNIKSNSEYDEHIVETVTVEDNRYLDNASLIYLPPATPQALHQYHFRTTFTVDSHGEHAIQQMLLSHPLLTTLGSVGTYNPDRYHHRRRRGDTSTSFRRSIYNQNLWVYSPPDITGRYRDVSPTYYRNNPAARTRLVPWLNRELNALLFENTQHVMHLVDIIMDHLLRHHICNPVFRTLLNEYLGHKTDHFIHEFYNFMRSPFDMIGYDRHVVYTERPSPTPLIDISDYDSDVIIVTPTNSNSDSSAGNPETVRTDPVVIDLLDSDSDVPVIVSEEPSPPRPSIATNSTNTNSTSNNNNINSTSVTTIDSTPEEGRKTVLPLKLRIKLCRNSREKNKKRWYRVQSQHPTSSKISSSSSSDADSSTSEHAHKRSSHRDHHHHRKSLWKVSKSKRRRGEDDVDNEEDDLPLSAFASTSSNCTSTVAVTSSTTSNSSSKWKKSKHHSKKRSKKHSSSSSHKRMKSESHEPPSAESPRSLSPRRSKVKDESLSDGSYYNDRKPNVKSKVSDVSKDRAGPSSGKAKLKDTFRKEDDNNMGKLWYSRPWTCRDSSESDS